MKHHQHRPRWPDCSWSFKNALWRACQLAAINQPFVSALNPKKKPTRLFHCRKICHCSVCDFQWELWLMFFFGWYMIQMSVVHRLGHKILKIAMLKINNSPAFILDCTAHLFIYFHLITLVWRRCNSWQYMQDTCEFNQTRIRWFIGVLLCLSYLHGQCLLSTKNDYVGHVAGFLSLFACQLFFGVFTLSCLMPLYAVFLITRLMCFCFCLFIYPQMPHYLA